MVTINEMRDCTINNELKGNVAECHARILLSFINHDENYPIAPETMQRLISETVTNTHILIQEALLFRSGSDIIDDRGHAMLKSFIENAPTDRKDVCHELHNMHVWFFMRVKHGDALIDYGEAHREAQNATERVTRHIITNMLAFKE